MGIGLPKKVSAAIALLVLFSLANAQEVEMSSCLKLKANGAEEYDKLYNCVNVLSDHIESLEGKLKPLLDRIERQPDYL